MMNLSNKLETGSHRCISFANTQRWIYYFLECAHTRHAVRFFKPAVFFRLERNEINTLSYLQTSLS
jgi:hypothetical protein